MAHDVFISYSTQDKATAEAVCHALEAEGVRCWIAPRDALPGRRYQGSIVGAIRRCRAMVLVFSSGSNESAHVFREVALAGDHGKAVIPFRVEDVAMNDDLLYYIGSVHWLDALTPPLQAHVERLVSVVEGFLAPGETARPSEEPEREAAEAGGEATPMDPPAPTTPAVPVRTPAATEEALPLDAFRSLLVVDGAAPSVAAALLAWGVLGCVTAILSTLIYGISEIMVGPLFGGAIALVGTYASTDRLWKRSVPWGVLLVVIGSTAGWMAAQAIGVHFAGLGGPPGELVTLLCGTAGATVIALSLLWAWRLERHRYAFVGVVIAAGGLMGMLWNVLGEMGLGENFATLFVLWQSVVLAAVASAPYFTWASKAVRSERLSKAGAHYERQQRWAPVFGAVVLAFWTYALWPAPADADEPVSVEASSSASDSAPEEPPVDDGVAQPTVSIDCPASITVGEAGTFTAFVRGGGGGPSDLTWEMGDGGTATGAMVTHVYDSEGTYTATASVVRGAGSVTQSCLVTVAPPIRNACSGGGGRLTGRVVTGDGEPLPGANVVIEGTTMGAATNVSGWFSLRDTPTGRCAVRVTFVGFTPLTGYMTLSERGRDETFVLTEGDGTEEVVADYDR